MAMKTTFILAIFGNLCRQTFFATDMVNVEMVFPLGAWLDEQLAAGKLSREAYEKICWKNAQSVFGL